MSTVEKHTTTTTTMNHPGTNTAQPADTSSSNTTTSSDSIFPHNPVLDAKETAHRMAEKAEETANSVKRATIGGSEFGDKTSETIHQGSNRLSEVRERMADSWNKTMGPVSDKVNGPNAPAVNTAANNVNANANTSSTA